LFKVGPLPQTQKCLIRNILTIWSAYNRKEFTYYKTSWFSLVYTWLEKSLNLSEIYHHILAVIYSPRNKEKQLLKFSISTLIIHNIQFQFFPTENCYALEKIINVFNIIDC
jgi:hypothetical protein